MGVSPRHLLQQGPMLGALADTVLGALRQNLADGAPDGPVLTPGAPVRQTLAPPADALVDDFVRHLGGDPRAYRGHLPAHLFPQWAMPALVRAMRGLPYPMLRGVNAGCELRVRTPLPRGETLEVEAYLGRVEEGARSVRLTVHGTTSTASAPLALQHTLSVSVPLPASARRDADADADRRAERPDADARRVPHDARELSRVRLSAGAGRAFAALTGDVNPIHWLPPYARASGFSGVILHGFGTFAHAVEGLTGTLLGGDPNALSSIEARFLKPLVLPAEVALFVAGDRLAVGHAPAGPAYMTGRFAMRETP